MIQWGQSTHATCKQTTEDALIEAYTSAIRSGNVVDIRRIESQLDVLDERERTRALGPAALYYATRWGWPVFPLIPGDKRPITRNGFRDATTDPEKIRRWWTSTPQANIGVPTGIAFDVLDIDWRDKSGERSQAHELWPALRDADPAVLPPIHGVAMTPRGGLHVLFEPTGETNHAGQWRGAQYADRLSGLDFRGAGGYVVVAPSRMNEQRWAWAVTPSPAITGRSDLAA